MADCNSLISKICGMGRGLVLPKNGCGSIRFVGVDDITITQGDAIDLTDGVYAYDGNGNEVSYEVIPPTIDTSVPGTYNVIYTAKGASPNLKPNFCGEPKLHTVDCGDDSVNAERTITVKDGQVPTCFTKGTRVWTDKGLVNIEDVAVGGKVLAYNDLTEQNEYAEVLNTIESEAIDLYEISVGGETLKVTSEHQMYVPSEGTYKAVKDIAVGDGLLKQDGAIVPVESITELSGTFNVCNLEVESLSNYYVGESGYLSYNMNISGVMRLSPKSFRSSNATHTFSLICSQEGKREPLDSETTFSYEVTPLDSAPTLYPTYFNIVGEKISEEVSFRVDISEDGIYSYSIVPQAASTPCEEAEEEYKIELNVVGGVLKEVDVYLIGDEQTKINVLIFRPRCSVSPDTM